MGFDSGPGIMYKGQALLLCQVIGKLPLTDAELVIKHASSRSYALFDYFKPEFIKSAQEQGFSCTPPMSGTRLPFRLDT